MDVLFDRVAGLVVGKASVTVCVRMPGPDGRRSAETRTFSTMTRSLEFIADWLVECGVTLAGMESTATYWKPVFYCLEDRFETWLLNGQAAAPGEARYGLGQLPRAVSQARSLGRGSRCARGA